MGLAALAFVCTLKAERKYVMHQAWLDRYVMTQGQKECEQQNNTLMGRVMSHENNVQAPMVDTRRGQRLGLYCS